MKAMRCWMVVVGLLGGLVAAESAAPQDLSLDQWLERVWTQSEEVQAHWLREWAAREEEASTRGLLEPSLVLDAAMSDQERLNTTEQSRSLGDTDEFNEKRWQYGAALEKTLSTGAKIRLGANTARFENNLNAERSSGGEDSMDVLLSIRQPLLKDAGPAVTLAERRAAAINSALAYQEYRRSLSEVLAHAEALYWDLAQAQAQWRFALQSLDNARTLLGDGRKRLELGVGSETDVLRAESGVALRQATARQAEMLLADVRQRMAGFLGLLEGEPDFHPTTLPRPPPVLLAMDAPARLEKALEANPELRALRERVDLEALRHRLASNQRLVQVDLLASAGAMGLGQDKGEAWDLVENRDHPKWSLGLEMRVPLGGDPRSLHRLRRTALDLEAARRSVSARETRLAQALRGGAENLASLGDMHAHYQGIVQANAKIYEIERKRLEAGQSDSRRVLEAEQDLFRSRIELVDLEVQAEKARLRLELIEGSLLSRLGVDLSPETLRDRSAEVLGRGRLDAVAVDRLFRRMGADFDAKSRETPAP